MSAKVQVALRYSGLVLFAFFQVFAAKARAADPFLNVLGGVGPIYNGAFFASAYAPNSGGPLAPSILENRLRVVEIVSQDSEAPKLPKVQDVWGVQGTFGNFHLSDSPFIPSALGGFNLSTNFYDIEAGFTYRHPINPDHDFSLSFSLGSASDVPFNSIYETVITATATYRIVMNRNESWLLLVNESTNRTFANYVPIPGAVYNYVSTDKKFSLSAGFPLFNVSDEFLPDTVFKFSFIGISQLSTEVNHVLAGPIKAYLGFDWGQQVWERAFRDDTTNRLFYDQKKLSLGLRSPLSPQLFADFSAGYEFMRKFFEAHSVYSSPLNTADVPAGFVAQVNIGLRQQ